MMKVEFNHLNHATWECKYHVVFTPKYRKKLLFGKIKRHLGQVFHDLARRKECRIEERRTENAEFSRPQILAARILCHNRWPGRGSDPSLHQKPRTGRSATGSV
jgi:hypothetical protein